MPLLLRWRQPSWLRWRLLLGIALLVIFDVWMHRRRLAMARPASNLYSPFHVGFQEQPFLNDQPWESDFVAAATEALAEDGSGATASLETISPEMCGYPDWIDRSKARSRMLAFQRQGVRYAGDEIHHHKRRSQSGFSYTHAPFVEMNRHRNRHDYAMALWRDEATAPSLFHKLSRYKTERRLPGSALWTAMMSPTLSPLGYVHDTLHKLVPTVHGQLDEPDRGSWDVVAAVPTGPGRYGEPASTASHQEDRHMSQSQFERGDNVIVEAFRLVSAGLEARGGLAGFIQGSPFH
ncbi:hypothetical protein CDD80_3152 [Ophiocordyceps camponoti-rufipedis]|uniref:Uncharacterized protein n=1 Tax=Ophiocordyceps camponoti-rufipedis TaxID=2004952 RepID=A0A2C5Z3A5_9HYPO|nr:hypothetical protein CDD80_3152 [Ophiocordyceps camponoti-rufipedis]